MSFSEHGHTISASCRRSVGVLCESDRFGPNYSKYLCVFYYATKRVLQL